MTDSTKLLATLATMPPEEAVKYMQARELLTPTFDWRDLWHEEHAHQFTVSRLARLDLLQAIYDGVHASVNGQLGRRDFMRGIKDLLVSEGWWGEKTVTDPKTGEQVTTTFDAARLNLIYDVNTRQAYAAGQWARIERNKATSPYIRYITKRDERVRASHRAWDNVTLPVDHPWLDTHTPSNGWRCRCRITTMSQAEYDKGLSPTGQSLIKNAPPEVFVDWENKRTGETMRIPKGIDPGFDYNPGKAGARQAALDKVVQEKLARASGPIKEAAKKDFEPPRPWKAGPDTAEGQWLDAAFSGSPQWIKDGVAKRGPLKGGVTNDGKSARYKPMEDGISMAGKDDKSKLPDIATWRHEYGHAMDRAFQNGFGFRSSAPDFTDAMSKDAYDLVMLGGHGPSKNKATKAAKLALDIAYKEAQKGLVSASDSAKWLQDRYAQSGFDFGRFETAMKAHTDFAVTLQGADLQARYARAIVAIEQRDAQGLMDALTGGLYSAEAKETFRKGALGKLSDLFGSATRNKVSGVNKSGWGHEDSYYKKFDYLAKTECFADLTSLYGDESEVFGKIVEAMTPFMAALFREILK